MAVQKVGTNIIDSGYTTTITTNPELSGTSHMKVPVGTTAQRPVSPVAGYLRFNTTIGKLEQYDGSDWSAIDSPPVVSSVSPSTELGSDDPQSIVITGSNFSSIVTAKVIGNNLTEYTPTTVTRNSSSQVTITFAGGDRLTGTNEPYDVKVINSSGLSAVLEDAFNINDVPTWSTASGSLGTVYEDAAISTITVSATDPESVGITYSVVSGSLPTGLSLNSSTGNITGTVNADGSYNSSGVTHNFTLGASDGAQTINRSFSILRKWYDGTSEASAASSATYIKQINSSATSGLYWIKPAGTGTAYQTYCDFTYDGGGWVMVFAYTKSQSPVANVSSYYASPQIAATAQSISLSTVARPHDPAASFCLPDSFWQAFGSGQQGNGELREEFNISGGTWPNTSNRVVVWHGGRTSGGAAGNYLTSTQMSQARTTLGYTGRNSYNFEVTVGSNSRSGYLSNTIGAPSRYSGSATDSVLGISVDASNLGTAGTSDGTNSYTNQTSATGDSWMGRGNGYSAQGTSANGSAPDGTRWGLIFIR